MDSLYFPQLSPIAAFKFVYKGSSSIRCARLVVLNAFWEGNEEAPLTLESDNEDGTAAIIGSVRLRAAGSMSGMLVLFQRKAPKYSMGVGAAWGSVFHTIC